MVDLLAGCCLFRLFFWSQWKKLCKVQIIRHFIMSLPPLKRNIIQGSMATEKKSKLIDIGKRKNTHSSFLIYLGCSFRRQFLVLKKMLNIIATNLSQTHKAKFSSSVSFILRRMLGILRLADTFQSFLLAFRTGFQNSTFWKKT